MSDISGRVYAERHRVAGRRDMVDFLADAVEASGGRLLRISHHTAAPWHFAAALPDGGRLAAMVYGFRSTTEPIRGRDPSERRFQLRYGSEQSGWARECPVGFDPALAEPTLMLGMDLDAGVFVAVDPALYDPLPMKISIEYPVDRIEDALERSWVVWERETRSGNKREARQEGLETLVAFTPDRLLDWVKFEAEAQAVGLDHGLRYRAAQMAARRDIANLRHELEEFYGLSADEILDVIAERFRLGVAVRGGVAERHLRRTLQEDPAVVSVEPIDEDGRPDFRVGLSDGASELVECKVVAGERYADGSPKVEVQKTRASKDDPSSRYYTPGQFSVVAACIQPVTDRWEFRFRRTDDMPRHDRYPDRLAVMHRVDEGWTRQYPTS